MQQLRILINEDTTSDAVLLEYAIRNAEIDFVSTRVEAEDEFLAALREFIPDIIISDYSLPAFNGMQALELAKELAPHTPFIIVTGSVHELTAVECMKAGADDYVLKDHLVRIGPAIEASIIKNKALKQKYLSERKLAESERKLRAIFENVNDAILVIDGTVIVDCNSAAAQMFGLPRENLLYHSPVEFSPHEQPTGCISRELLEDKLKDTLQGKPQFFEWRHQKADNRPFDVEIGLSLTEIEDKPMVLAVLRDISERKSTENILRDNEAKFKRLSLEFTTLLNAIPDYILLHAPDMEILWTNNAVKEKFDEKIPLPEERNCHALIHGMSVFHDKCPVRECIDTGIPVKDIVKVHEVMTWEIRAIPILDDEGKLESVLEICRDITEMKNMEKQLMHAQKMEVVGQLAGGVAHDFNNIITALIGYGNLVRMKMVVDDPSIYYVDQMLITAERAAELTQSLLAFSRKKESHFQVYNINEMISSVGEFIVRLIGEDIKIKISPHQEPLFSKLDYSQFEQVLSNLATNARDAMPEGGVLSLSTERCELDADFVATHGYGEPGCYVRISVSDTGCGIDEKNLSRIFEPFFTTKDIGKGTGLGLSMAYNIVKDHKGYITVYSEKGIGTTFNIYLALLEENPRKESVRKPAKPLGGTETILIAEDEDSVRKMLARFLTDFGYTVLQAEDGEVALTIFKQAKDEIHLLLLDVLMPKKGGKEVSIAVKEQRPDMKIIFNSGYPLDMLQEKDLLHEGVDYYLKPISPNELLNKIRDVLDRPENISSRI
jgi:PAS domain S-box-containing protein